MVGGETTTVLVAGDDEDAKAALIGAVEVGGLAAIDAGSLVRARELEAVGFRQIALAAEKVSGGRLRSRSLNRRVALPRAEGSATRPAAGPASTAGRAAVDHHHGVGEPGRTIPTKHSRSGCGATSSSSRNGEKSARLVVAVQPDSSSSHSPREMADEQRLARIIRSCKASEAFHPSSLL